MAWEQRREHEAEKAHEYIIANNNNSRVVNDQLSIWVIRNKLCSLYFDSEDNMQVKHF